MHATVGRTGTADKEIDFYVDRRRGCGVAIAGQGATMALLIVAALVVVVIEGWGWLGQ